jgi:hypothetical protein
MDEACQDVSSQSVGAERHERVVEWRRERTGHDVEGIALEEVRRRESRQGAE